MLTLLTQTALAVLNDIAFGEFSLRSTQYVLRCRTKIEIVNHITRQYLGEIKLTDL